jgi:hypothetical protein
LSVAKLCAEADQLIPRRLRHEFYERLPFDRSVFSKLAAIGRTAALHNPDVESSLPPSYSILYIARKLTSDELDRAITNKIITPDTNRADLERWMSIPGNCRYHAVTRDDSGRAFSDVANQAQMIETMVKAWEASPALVEQWRWSPYAVRMAFLRELKKR